MNNWCICWLFTHILLGILIFKGLTARRLYNSFSVKGLTALMDDEWEVGGRKLCLKGLRRCADNCTGATEGNQE
jgi:hypothetical protein